MPVPDDMTDVERAVHKKLTAVRKEAEKSVAAAEQEAVKILYGEKKLSVERVAAVMGVGRSSMYARIDEAGVHRRHRSGKVTPNLAELARAHRP